MDNKKQVLNVLPSLFEEFIEIENLKFYVHKLDTQSYISFAYNEEHILQSIKKSGLQMHQIKNIYFSQIEFYDQLENTKQMKIDNVSLSFVNNIIVKIPDNIKMDIQNTVDIENIKLSKESISISSNSKYIDNRTSNILSIFLILFSILFLVKIDSNYTIIGDYENRISNIKNVNNKSLSNIQIKSIIKKYDKIYNKQVEIRELLSYILNMKSIHDIKFLSIEMQNKNLKVKFMNNKIDSTLENKIRAYIQKRYKKYVIKNRDNYILMEVRI